MPQLGFVPKGSLRVSLRVQHVVHARNDEGDNGCRLFSRCWLDRRPQLGLQLNSAGADLPQLFFIVNRKK